MHYDTLLFDLDGTISDPKIGITRSVQYALARFNIVVEDLDSLVDFIGPPLREAFKTKYAMEEPEVERAVRYYREYFSRSGVYENRLYPGMKSLLKGLRSAKKRIILATTKPETFANRILQHFRIDDYFSGIFGSNLDGSRASKVELISSILARGKSIRKDRTVMIGDRALDIQGARVHRLDSIGVTYGYGSRKEIEESYPTHLVHSVSELKSFLCENK
jgi:phosphoglycolate phosphatase